MYKWVAFLNTDFTLPFQKVKNGMSDFDINLLSINTNYQPIFFYFGQVHLNTTIFLAKLESTESELYKNFAQVYPKNCQNQNLILSRPSN